MVDGSGLGEKVNEKNFSEASETKDLDEGAHMTTANRGMSPAQAAPPSYSHKPCARSGRGFMVVDGVYSHTELTVTK